MNYSGDQCYTLSWRDEKIRTWVLQSHICMTILSYVESDLEKRPQFLERNETKEHWSTDPTRYPGMMQIDIPKKISWSMLHNEENPEF